MKRLMALLTAFCLAMMPLLAQDSPLDAPVTLDMDNIALEDVIDAMMRQTGVMFLYKRTDIGASRKVSVHASAVPIRQVLRQLDVDARAEGRNLILTRKDTDQHSESRPAKVLVKPRTKVSGHIMDTRGEPLIGATIMIHGTSEGTSTDLDGNFSLEAAEGDLIDALLIGYRTVSQKAAARLDFVLEDDITQLEEVVVVGYGVQKKVNLTGSVESLGGEAMENLPMPSLSRGLQGMIPSLNIDMTDGKPIRSSEYNVRGTTSIGAGGGSTLIMIDGAPGDPDLLNPGDIESVTVLKDAASAAIYGARGPFGVVLITTKNPSAGKTSVTYSGNVSFYTQTQHNDYIWDGYTWAKSFVEAYYAYNDYVTNPTGVNNAFPFMPNLETYLSELKRRHDDPSLPKVAWTEDGKYLYYGSTNWYDELYKKVSSGTEHTLTLSGSARNVGYYLSGRYYGQGGIFKYNSDDFNQFNLRGKGYIQIFPWLKVSDNVDFSRRSYKYPLTSIYEKGIWRNIADQGFPMAVMYNPDGTMPRHAAYTVGDFKTGYNKSLSSQFNLRNTVNLTASFLNNSLRVNGDFTYSYRFSRDKRILVDLHKMTEGKQDAVIMVAYLKQLERDDASLLEATAKANRILTEIEEMAAKNKDYVEIAYTPEDILRLKMAGKKAIMLGIENGYAVGKDIRNVERFRKRGVVYMTLCHNGNNDICGSAKDNPEDLGVSAFGESVIHEMNRVGMMVDISHTGRHTFYDALEISSKPIVASHSSVRDLCNHPRNLDDEQMRALARKGGVAQVTLYNGFLRADGQATIMDAVHHLNHMISVMGIEHVGIGTDFDGDGGITGCACSSELINFTKKLLKERFTEDDLRLIWGGNFLRVMKEVQDVKPI